MFEAAAVDVEGLEDLANGLERNAPVVGPDDDVEIFLAGFETIENSIEKKGFVLKASLQQTEVAAVEFEPEVWSLADVRASVPADNPTSAV